MRAWLILAALTVGDWITSYTYHRHLTTDPACKQYRAPRAGSALDRHSRGVMCTPCMASAAFGDHECRPFPVSIADLIDPYDDLPPWQGCEVAPEGWWCSQEPGHEGPCAARPNPRPHSTELRPCRLPQSAPPCIGCKCGADTQPMVSEDER